MRCWQLVDSLCHECVFLQLGGVALIATGAFAVASTDSFLWMVIDNRLISQAVYLVIAAGTLFFVIGILGLFGALMMDKTVLLVVSKKTKKLRTFHYMVYWVSKKDIFTKLAGFLLDYLSCNIFLKCIRECS